MEQVMINQDSISFGDMSRLERIYQVIFMIWLIGISGSPLFIANAYGLVIGLTIYAILGIAFVKINLFHFAKSLLVFAAILLIQYLYFGSYYAGTQIFVFLNIFQAMMAVAIMSTGFFHVYHMVLKVIAIISLVLFIPILINPSMLDIILSYSPVKFTLVNRVYEFDQVAQNIVVMNFNSTFEGLRRNSGPFWEPTVYGAFLLLGLIHSSFESGSVFTKRGLIYIATIITTFSTTTYLATSLFVFCFYIILYKDPLLRLISLITFMVIFMVGYSQIDFLGDKIENEVKNIQSDAIYLSGNTRLSSAYLDITELPIEPFYIFFGRGAHSQTRVETWDKTVFRINGITDQLSRWGIPCFIFFFFGIKRSFGRMARYYSISPVMSWVAFASLIIMSFSELFFNLAFFTCFFFFQEAYKYHDEALSDIQADVGIA
ncbi:hypothetical protein [Flavihumibacter profundi]|uniref:hypothetical protein n=1 Tax=Flavihumibacter profundi TaxID=2716883 RepID=UPI001CC41A01|nr:hypothetical protein [Flavihumibacter profundi]MBZ5855767.1 hypothetical protein [Flavihumibacter profundi]